MLGAMGIESIDDLIMFEVSDEKILTFNNFVRSNSVRFSKHDILLKKPVPQYVGKDLDTIQLQIILKSELGTNPRAEMDKLIIIQRDGIPITLVIGNGGFGYLRWTIQNLDMKWNRVDSKGFLHSATCDISLQEYI